MDEGEGIGAGPRDPAGGVSGADMVRGTGFGFVTL